MTITVNAGTYTGDSFLANLVGYIGAAKTVSVKDDLRLSRSAPKPSAVFSGVGRTTSKMTRTLALTGALTPTGDAICEINVSVPVGYSGTDVDALLDDMGALLASASFKAHVKSQKISF